MQHLFLFSAALCAGFIDAIAGGGGLITLPALLLCGVPAPQALATNRLQGTFGSLSATMHYRRAGLFSVRDLRLAIVTTALAAVLGAFAVNASRVQTLKAMIPITLVLAAAYFAAQPLLKTILPPRQLSKAKFASFAAGPIGFYDGFFGPGAGSLYTLAFSLFTASPLMRAVGQAKLLNFTSNAASLAVFAWAGLADIRIGFMMGLGQLTGAWLGARTAIRHGETVIRPLLAMTTLMIALKLWLST